jgi:MFS family permease
MSLALNDGGKPTASEPSALVRRTAFLRVLGNREFRTYYLGNLASVTGHQMMIATLAWLVFRLTGSPLALGLVGGVQAIPGFALNLVAGALADRVNPKHLIILAQGATALLTAVMATIIVTGAIEVWHIVVISLLTGFTTNFDGPARRTVWPHLVDRSEFMFAASLNQSVWSSTRIVAPALAGFTIAASGELLGDELLGAGATVYISFLGFLAMAVAIAMVRVPPIKRSSGATILHDIVEGLLFTKRNTIFLILLGMTFFNGFFGVSYMWLMPVFAEDYLGVDVQGFGVLMSFSGIGGVLGAVAIASFGQYQNRPWLVVGSTTLFGTSILLFAVSSALLHSFPLALLLVLLGGFFYSVTQVASTTILTLLVPDEFRGRVMGLRSLTWSIAPLGSLTTGLVATLVNTAFAVGLNSVMVILFGLLIVATNAQIRNLRAIAPSFADGLAGSGASSRRRR